MRNWCTHISKCVWNSSKPYKRLNQNYRVRSIHSQPASTVVIQIWLQICRILHQILAKQHALMNNAASYEMQCEYYFIRNQHHMFMYNIFKNCIENHAVCIEANLLCMVKIHKLCCNHPKLLTQAYGIWIQRPILIQCKNKNKMQRLVQMHCFSTAF